ncbi:MAG: 50S ribosomal protein L20 [Patescibacteria group bacterium]|jgi:large subunit ribosomal protein L20
MPRVKRAILHLKKRRTLRKRTKGFIAGRKSSMRLGRTASVKAGAHSYVGRKTKKRDMRALWNQRISAGLKEFNLSYSKFIGALNKNKIIIDRKILAQLAAEHPKVFAAIVNEIKK